MNINDPIYLDVEMVQEIGKAIAHRMSKFTETVQFAASVVLLNYGDKYKEVECVKGEWSGTKADLPPTNRLPVCPNGHPLFEGLGKRLALVDEEQL
jgi:hypothetical protein